MRARRREFARRRAEFQALILLRARVCVKTRMLTSGESVLVSCGKLSLGRFHKRKDFHDPKQLLSIFY